MYAATRKVTVDGLELMFAVNQLAYQAFTVPLIPLLKAAGHARVVNGTGALEAAGEIDFDDLQSEKSYKPFKALTQSKLGNLLFTRELARRLDGTGVTVTAFHPGGVKTTFGAGEGGVLGWVMGFARMFVPIALALDGAYASVTGQYFLELKPGEPSAKARDPERARRLWEIGERLSGARFPEASG